MICGHRSATIMRFVKRNGHWIVALLGIVSLAYSAGLIQARLPGLPGATAADPRAVAEANQLSIAFRDAARTALPAIVSIETKGKSVQVSGQEGNPEEMF